MKGMQMNGYIRRGVTALLAAAMVSVAACGGGGAGPSGDANILKRGTASEPPSIDRKSVVLGKSVSVRVDLGGRRIIKKKKTNIIKKMAWNTTLTTICKH